MPTDEARWPDLESLSLEMSSVRPDDGWYLGKHPDVPLGEPVTTGDRAAFDSDDSEDGELDPEFVEGL